MDHIYICILLQQLTLIFLPANLLVLIVIFIVILYVTCTISL